MKTLCLSLGMVALLAAGATARGVTEVAGRPFHLRVPASYDGSKPVPLVIMLHGIGVTSTYQETYLEVGDAAESSGVIYAYPDGSRGPAGQFWNGAHCCQDPLSPPVDDVGYLDGIISYVRTNFRLDERRIFLIGHSNGAFMASRYACERPQIAAIVTLSGGQYFDPLTCGKGSTSVLHIHGTHDTIISHGGPGSWPSGEFAAGLPNGVTTVANWMFRNGCFPIGWPLPARDLDASIAGNETTGVVYGCAVAALEFWTIWEAPHIPTFYQTPEQSFGRVALDWLLLHGRMY